MAINPVSMINMTESIMNMSKPEKIERVDFGKMFNEALNEVNRTDAVSKETGEKMAVGELENPHDAAITATEAEITLNYVIEVKNKIVEAYKELTRMQI